MGVIVFFNRVKMDLKCAEISLEGKAGKPVQIHSSDFQPGLEMFGFILKEDMRCSFSRKIWRRESRFKSTQANFSQGCAVVGTFRKWGC